GAQDRADHRGRGRRRTAKSRRGAGLTAGRPSNAGVVGDQASGVERTRSVRRTAVGRGGTHGLRTLGYRRCPRGPACRHRTTSAEVPAMTTSPQQFRSRATGPVLTEKIGAVGVVTLNRPDKLNAIDIPLRLALADAIEAADRDTSVRAVVLTGAGKAFCSGGDIASMERMAPQEALERAQLAQRVIRAIWSTEKPVIAAVEGAAYGAGAALAAACDRVVAARDARF